MRRPLSIALASLFAAALLIPTAQAATRRYWFDMSYLNGAPGPRISVVLLYKNKQRHGRYTPRQASAGGTVPVSCNPPVNPAWASTGGLAKMRKGSFTYSDIRSESSFSVTGTGTGKLLKKKPGVREQMRVDGSVSVLDYSYPANGFHNCTSGGPVPYSATPCRPSPYSNPPYIKKSLRVCSQG
jgi:hypothetical protein